MANLLITGASGFIGSFLVEEGLRAGFDVFAGIRASSSRKYLTDPRIRFAVMDFSSKEAIKKNLEDFHGQGIRFDYIIHNAGITKAQNKEEYFRVNSSTTRAFLEALRETGSIPGKFIFISSLAAYGPGDPKSGRPVMLADEPKPIEIYGKSKLEAETYILQQDDIPWLIFRPTGVYGPREKDYFVFFKTIHGGMEPYIGKSPQILTFIYVRDLVRLVVGALRSGKVHKAYFVADGKEYDSREFAAITKKHLGKRTFRFTLPLGMVKAIAFSMEKIYGIWGGMPTLNSDKYNVLSSTNWRCETAPLEQDFGFRAEYDLDRGVKETLEWYKKEKWL